METSAAGIRDILTETLQSVQRTNENVASLVRALMDWEPPRAAPATTRTPPKEIMSVAEAAEYCGYSKSSLYVLIHQKRIPCHRPAGGRVFFKRQELEGFLSRGKQDADYELEEQAAAILNGEAVPGVTRRRRRSRRRAINGD